MSVNVTVIETIIQNMFLRCFGKFTRFDLPKILSRQLYHIPTSVSVNIISYIHYGRFVYFRINRCKKNLHRKLKSEGGDITAKVSLNTSGCKGIDFTKRTSAVVE